MAKRNRSSYQRLKRRLRKTELELEAHRDVIGQLNADLMEVVHNPTSRYGKGVIERVKKRLYFHSFSDALIDAFPGFASPTLTSRFRTKEEQDKLEKDTVKSPHTEWRRPFSI